MIAFISETKENNFVAYASSRAARLYSVVLPCLFIVFALDTLGRRWMPELYYGITGNGGYGYSDINAPKQFFQALFFTGEVWGSRSIPGSDTPYWSLGYEVPYYIAYAMYLFAPRRLRLLGAAIVLLAFGPRVAALFPVWLFGVAAYRWGSHVRFPAPYAAILFIGTLFAFPVLRLLPHPRALVFEHAHWPDFLSDYLIGICVAANLIELIIYSPFMAVTFRKERARQ